MMSTLKLDDSQLFIESIVVYVKEVLSELKRDDEFIKHLKKSKFKISHQNIEKYADEWASRQRSVTPEQLRIAKRISSEKFHELVEKYRGDEGAAKRALFSLINSIAKKKK